MDKINQDAALATFNTAITDDCGHGVQTTITNSDVKGRAIAFWDSQEEWGSDTIAVFKPRDGRFVVAAESSDATGHG